MYKDLFKGANKYYAEYRKPYPREVIRQFVSRFQLEGSGTLEDQ
ncbi:hypothetical protein [Guptibacillus hwajinpoensis]|nr:hypothetical protein [Pseudalkalibacillus hwajinpoensis]WLR60381.1 hypothetical protein LC071_03135 [Pseudalkalibacillus hwajinpoensis]